MFNILDSDDVSVLSRYAGEDVLAKLRTNRYVCYELESGYLLAFHYFDIRKTASKEEKVVICISGDDLTFITENPYIVAIAKALDTRWDNARKLAEFFVSMTMDDVLALESFEDRIDELEDRLMDDLKLDKANMRKIVLASRELLRMKRYYDQLSAVMSVLAENSNKYFSKEIQKRFELRDQRMDRLLGLVMHLHEYVTQLREAYKSQLDLEQNNIMRIFTVITAVFLTLTLIVGWYGMNVMMPETGWRYGYPFVTGLCVAVAIVCVIIFKRKKWF
jgi:magnesium transporter